MRLIDVDALIETMRENAEGNEGWYGDTWAFMQDIEDAPTIDAAPVVRCRDCKWRNTIGCDSYVASLDRHCCEDDDFCKWGERKDDE